MIVRMNDVSDEEIRKAVRELRQHKCRTFPDGYYHGHISWEMDRNFRERMKYENPPVYEYARAYNSKFHTAIYGAKLFADLHGEIPYMEGLDAHS